LLSLRDDTGMSSGPEQLRDWMERRSFNQTETALYLGFDVPYISQLLSRTRSPGLPRAIVIERKTGIPVEAWASENIGELDPEPVEIGGRRRVANR
jgi:transcriptional regulator with XRE-family HTH domain